MPTYLLDACRTPLGALGGSLKRRSAPELAAAAMAGVLARTGPDAVEECLVGQAVPAGAGPSPAREAARRAGLPPGIPAATVNQGSASGLLAVILACRGEADLALAGGMESSSQAPYLLPSARWGTRMGTAPVLDALLQDALWPAPDPLEEDRRRALAARDAGLFLQETASLDLGADDLQGPDPLPADGAAMVLLGSRRRAEALAPRSGILARILAWGEGDGERGAALGALRKAGLALQDVDLFELDAPEALPEVPGDHINARGGAASLGLAPGAEGARKVVTLAHQLRHGKLRYGLAALACDGFGLALVLEAP